MNQSFRRKVLYLLGMVVLLFPLSLLSQPDTRKVQDGSAGGQLAQMRAEAELTQADLGAIDPTSETFKLATLGMRGVAANLLWFKANEFQKKQQWTNLSATLEQIAHLQPNFIAVWRYQGWNIAYNVSVEWDDYRQRYAWVLKGVKYFKQGMEYNKKEPILPWEVGWVLGHKMGTADEKREYRVLFRKDDDFHGDRPEIDRDNWLVGKDSLLEAQRIIDTEGARLKGVSPVIFHSHPPKWQTNYAAALEVDGGLKPLPEGKFVGVAVFGERARLAWDKAADEWKRFGETREIASSLGYVYRLEELEGKEAELKAALVEFDKLQVGLREQLSKEKKDRLPKEEQDVLNMPENERTSEQAVLASTAQMKIAVTHQEVADRMPAELKSKAQELALKIVKLEGNVRAIKNGREVIQYVYWKTRCEAERTADCLAARELMYKADRAFLDDADLVAAKGLYEDCFKEWRKVFDVFPSLMDDRVIGDDLVGPDYLPGAIRQYEKVVKQLGETLPKDFILKDAVIRINPDPPIAGL